MISGWFRFVEYSWNIIKPFRLNRVAIRCSTRGLSWVFLASQRCPSQELAGTTFEKWQECCYNDDVDFIFQQMERSQESGTFLAGPIPHPASTTTAEESNKWLQITSHLSCQQRIHPLCWYCTTYEIAPCSSLIITFGFMEHFQEIIGHFGDPFFKFQYTKTSSSNARSFDHRMTQNYSAHRYGNFLPLITVIFLNHEMIL